MLMMLILAIMRMMMLILAIMMARAISYRWMHFTAFLRYQLLKAPTNLHQKLSWHYFGIAYCGVGWVLRMIYGRQQICIKNYIRFGRVIGRIVSPSMESKSTHYVHRVCALCGLVCIVSCNVTFFDSVWS